MQDRWEQVAERLESLAAGPSHEQRDVAAALGIDLGDTPALVAAELIKAHLAPALLSKVIDGFELPDEFRDLEDQVGVASPGELRTGTRAEVSAWYGARYMLLTAQGLRTVRPQVGDVVSRLDSPDKLMLISSIGDDGVVYMRGGLGKRSWPNYLTVVARNDGSDSYKQHVARINSEILNAQKWHPGWSADLERLADFKVPSRLPSQEALRELEDLLESGERAEGPFQKLIERNPELLASLVHGNWGTYVIPQKQLGAEYVTDFLVLGMSSQGPQWVAVELEAPRHRLLTKEGQLLQPVRHAIDQIQDWREWLTTNVAYARSELALSGINDRLPGLVIIGRADAAANRDPARSRVAEQNQIHIHSWDWLLRDTQRVVAIGHPGNTLDFDVAATTTVDLEGDPPF